MVSKIRQGQPFRVCLLVFNYLFIGLYKVLAVALKLLAAAHGILFPQPGIGSRPPTLGVQSPSH